MKLRDIFPIIVTLLLVAPGFSDYLINSKDWKFAFLASEALSYEGKSFRYVISEKQLAILPYFINSGEEIYEDNNPVIGNLAGYIRSTAGKDVYTKKYTDFVELQRQLVRSGKFFCYFLVSPNEPENALVALEAARASGCLVIFSHVGIENYLKGSKITVVGRVSLLTIRNLKNAGNTIEIIDNGSPYENAKEIIRKFFAGTNSAYLSTGDFLEPSFFLGRPHPFILVGKGSYPRDLITFLRERRINTLYVIGTELLYVGRMIRDDSNKTIGVLVKYGEGYTNIPGYTGRVFALSMYRIRIPLPRFRIVNATYDPVRKSLYITVENSGDGQGYVLGYIDIKTKDGKIVKSIYDKEPFFVEPKANISIPYPADLTDYLHEELYAYITMKYGRYADFLTNYITAKGELPPVVMKISIGNVGEYSKCIKPVSLTLSGQNKLRLTVENTCRGTLYTTGYVAVEVDGRKDKVFFRAPVAVVGKKAVVLTASGVITQEPGTEVDVVLKIGKSPKALTSFVIYRMRLEEEKLNYGLIALGLIGVIAVAAVFAGRKRKHARVKTERLKRSKGKVRL